MMDLMTLQAPASRRALSIRPLLRHTFGHFSGDGPSLDGLTGGRPGDEYVTCYPMKKSRSHTSMAQTAESVLEADDCGYVVTSAPDNAFCLIDTDGDGDGDSACCEKTGGSADTSCCVPHATAPLQLHHSVSSSSTALSSAFTLISSPSPPALLASGLPCSSCGGSGLAHVASCCQSNPDSAATLPRANNHHPQQHQQHQLQLRQQVQGSAATAAGQTAAAPAPAAAAAGARAVVAEQTAAEAEACKAGMEGHGGGGGGLSGPVGSDLMGAFNVVTSDQWAAFQAAVGGRGPGPEAATAATATVTGASIGQQVQHAHQRERESAATIDWPMQPQQRGSVAAEASFAFEGWGLGAGAAAAAATTAAAAAGAAAAAATTAAAAAGGGDGAGCSGLDGGGSAEGTDRASPGGGGSASSIASLWAAVNSVANGAVYDSTDDNAQVGAMLGRCRGWSSSRAATAAAAAPAAPVVAPSYGSGFGVGCGPQPLPQAPAPAAAASSRARLHQEQHHHSHQQPAPSYNGQHVYGDRQPSYSRHPQHELEVFLAARHSHHSGVAPAVRLPALVTEHPDDGGRGGGGGALSLPGSPMAARGAVSCSSGSAGANGLFASTRNMLLREIHDREQQQQPQQRRQEPYAGASTTADGYTYGDGSAHGGGASGYSRAAEQARSNAHSRYSVDLSYYTPRQPSHASQQQIHQAAVAAATAAVAAAAAAQSNNADSPSRRRGGGAGGLALPPQPASYTTYGYRRARSSLAALEQSAAGGGAAVAVESSSDDEDDTEEATRRITAAFRTQTGMARSSGWGLLGPTGTDSAPITPGAEAGRRDHWAAMAAAAAGNGAAANGGSGGSLLGCLNGGSVHGGGSVYGGRKASGDFGGGEVAAGGAKDAGGGEGGGGGGDEVGDGLLTRKRGSYHLTNSHAAVELFLRLNHARQTMDFVKRQTQLFAGLDKAQLSVWEALQTLNELREYEAVLMAEGGEAQDVSNLSLLDHAFQTAELCRLHHPDLDWLHLVGLMHGLGKLLAHRRFGSQPQWAICGETYPLGCRFSPHILGAQYFTANPDRRRRLYNTPTGLYDPGCGLLNCVMSWSAPEYLYLVISLNSSRLPQDALWVLRHAKFLTLTRPHSCYLPLCSGDDLRRLPLLRSFQQLAAYRRSELPAGLALQGEERTAYYSGLIAKYLGEGRLNW
ncbi:hypothetical protein PLESTB_001349600 [Pleodorina starrii]|uniref:Inositol oxygenase n=1 Tax=Pleodorina starrii TaxID=330485 RepID=A0A9W6F7B4_9CHLO|nr:hypothetical protein PLESTM_000898600 [Pleodorina starrii]GLC58351.1 hypothetical protein PLESTB_001349600 [Pleodorina starrii]GLC69447.1 hypothetical protein PLESTF_000831800 [Pleodorina starrii]